MRIHRTLSFSREETSGVFRTIVDPEPDGAPYLTIICNNGKHWISND